MPDPSGSSDDYVHRHVRFGWWSFLVFATFGLVLETFHGFKLGAYLDANQETRRLMWTLAHAHGTLLSVVHIVFGTYTRMFPLRDIARQRFIWRCLLGASLLLPGGFFLGGVVFYSGDPGLGILLLPVGAVLLLTALFLIARSSMESPDAGNRKGRS